MSPETKLLLHISLLLPNHKPELTPVNWSLLLNKSLKHGLAPRLYQYLKTQTQSCPTTILHQLKQSYLNNHLRNLAAQQQIQNLKKELNGIPFLLLKGGALIHSIYAQDIALRPMSDIDILTAPENLDEAEKRLIKVGYKPDQQLYQSVFHQKLMRQYHHHLPSLKHPDKPLNIELHRQLSSKLKAKQLPFKYLWNRRLEMTIEHTKGLYGLQLCDQFLHIALHTYENITDGGLRLAWLTDLKAIADLLTDKALSKLTEKSENWGVEKEINMIISALQQCQFNIKLPEVSKKIGEKELKIFQTKFEALLDIGEERLKPNKPYLSAYKQLNKKGTRFLYLIHDLFPSKDYMYQRYKLHKSRQLLYYYPYRCWRALLRLLKGRS